MSKKANEPKAEKEFSLKPIEIQMIQNMNERANAAMFDYICTIAIERLAYQPIQGTQFRVDSGKLYISEVKVEEKPKEEVATA